MDLASGMMPIIGVSFEYALINKLMTGIQNNLQGTQPQPISQNTFPRKPVPVKNIVVDRNEQKPMPKQKIINFWNTEELEAHYKNVANIWGLPKDW